MNKKLIALALVLLIAVGGLFAVYTVEIPDAVNAYLKANVGEFLDHGFKLNENSLYNSSITVENAFDSDPVFTYGYRTNAQGNFEFRMSVGDFIHASGAGSGVVKIALVKKGGNLLSPETGLYYKIFTDNSETITSATRSQEAEITIVPAQTTLVTLDHLGQSVGDSVVEDAAPGTYTSTITISISAS